MHPLVMLYSNNCCQRQSCIEEEGLNLEQKEQKEHAVIVGKVGDSGVKNITKTNIGESFKRGLVQ